ncbi:tyrosine-type recombinase/integrase [Prauserella sp. PE36]|uniref:tyrosine-type recombinase/integrase n=1 Tax=Prauserella sp. PE36 TaxID=1504709 RepID=UPI001F1B14EC|nr:tyrosine-type recombinase/integrase [Prauserella sp. PE36]
MLRRRRRLALLDRDLRPGSVVPSVSRRARWWRDPSNTRRDLRTARGTDGFAWVTSHVFRKTCATILDEARFTPRQIADQLGHARPSLTQDVYVGRKVANPATADALQEGLDT